MNLKSVKSWLILALCASSIVNFFLQSESVRLLSAALTLIVFALALPGARRFTGVLSLIMFISALFIHLRTGGGLYATAEIIVANLPLITLIIAVPLLSVPWKEEGYFSSVQTLIRRWHANSRRIFAGISGFIFIFGPVLNLGILRLVHDMVKDLKLSERLLARAYLTGFSAIVIWSPFFASTAYVLYLLDVPIADYVPIGLPFAILQLVIGNLLFWFAAKKLARSRRELPPEAVPALSAADRNNILYLILMLSVIIVSIFAIEIFTRYPIMIIVVMVSVLFPFAWGAVRNKWRRLRAQLAEYKSNSVTSMDNEIIMLVSAGMFGASLSGTPLSAGIQEVFVSVSSFSFPLFGAGIILIIMILGAAGLHPIAVVAVLASQMSPELIGARPETLALFIMIGWSAVAVISPVMALNVLVSQYLNRSSYEVGIGSNALYLACLVGIGTLYASLFC